MKPTLAIALFRIRRAGSVSVARAARIGASVNQAKSFWNRNYRELPDAPPGARITRNN